jgi:hypothetical protein
MFSLLVLAYFCNGYRNTLIKAAEAHVRIVEHCLRLSKNTSASSQYILASCLAVFDRSWLALRFYIEGRRNCLRKMPAHVQQRVYLAITCSDFVKCALRSEFAGDLITTRAWISAITRAEQNERVHARIGYTDHQFVAISTSMQGNREESTKKLRGAILLADNLRWRWEAFRCISSENHVNAQCALKCAIVIVECLHCLLSCHDKAEITLLEAAVAAAEPHVLQFFLDAEVQVPSSLVDEVEKLKLRASSIDGHRREVTRNVEELETLVAQRDECQLPRLIAVYDEFIAASRMELSHSVECLEKLEAGDFQSVKWSAYFE